ncbi:MAG TPA: hypothetical protein VKZ18_22305 [Polyangia bacterium]|nr:hypothetical protein [Polyangia bacterium]
MQSAERTGKAAGGFWNPFPAAVTRALFVVVLAAAVGFACGSSSSPSDAGGTGGTTGSGGATGTGGATGSGGAGGKATGGAAGGKATGGATGAGGQGGVPAINGISQACQQCAETSCTTQILACAGASACQACVTNDYNSCITSQNTQYKAVCTCAKAACAACATYCP